LAKQYLEMLSVLLVPGIANGTPWVEVPVSVELYSALVPKQLLCWSYLPYALIEACVSTAIAGQSQIARNHLLIQPE
jgi:hypothetical protein